MDTQTDMNVEVDKDKDMGIFNYAKILDDLSNAATRESVNLKAHTEKQLTLILTAVKSA
jgi:hypothetical protein